MRKMMHRCFRQGSASSQFARLVMSFFLKRRDPLFATLRKDFSKARFNSKNCGLASTSSMPWSVSHRTAVLFALKIAKMSLKRTSASGNLFGYVSESSRVLASVLICLFVCSCLQVRVSLFVCTSVLIHRCVCPHLSMRLSLYLFVCVLMVTGRCPTACSDELFAHTRFPSPCTLVSRSASTGGPRGPPCL